MRISASTNPCPEDKLLDYIKELEDTNCDMIHCDRMDGHFVEAQCLDSDIVKHIHDNSSMFLDCHLMSVNPIKELEQYVHAGANIVTIHYEAIFQGKTITQIENIVKSIRTKYKSIMLGVSINPDTSSFVLKDIIQLFDLVLIMSVHPGKSGQKFIENSLQKIKEIKELIAKTGCHTLIEVDGGVNLDNVKSIKSAGADIVVVGSALYNSNDKSKFIDQIRA